MPSATAIARDLRAVQKEAQEIADVIAEQKRLAALSDRNLSFPEFCAAHLVKSGGRMMPFELWEWQKEVIDKVCEKIPKSDQPRVISWIKSRQLGASQILVALMIWEAWRNPAYVGVVVSKTGDDSSLLAYRMRELCETSELVTFTTDNLLCLRISGGGVLFFRNAGPNACRGIPSVSDLLFDEAAFHPALSLALTSAAPALSQVGSRGRIFLVSTPNGIQPENPFYNSLVKYEELFNTVEGMRTGEIEPVQFFRTENHNLAIAVHWRSTYGKNKRYLEDVYENLSIPWAQVLQEYDLSFTESAAQVFAYADVRACIFPELNEEEPASDDEIYYAGVDPSGKGKDNFCCVVLRKVGEMCFEIARIYRKRGGAGTIDMHISRVSDLLGEFQPVKALVETNGVGQFPSESLGTDWDFVEDWNSTQNSKEGVVARCGYALEKRAIHYKDESPVIQELHAYVRNEDGKLEAGTGHDDLVMALCLALKAAGFGDRAKDWMN